MVAAIRSFFEERFKADSISGATECFIVEDRANKIQLTIICRL